MNKTCCLLAMCLTLTGCYSNWEQLDSFANKIDCDTTKSQAIALAKKHQTHYQWDEEYKVLSISKEVDAIAIQFVPISYGSQLIRLDTITGVKATIQFFGLDRRQGDTYLILRCNMPTLS